ncbi:MAG: N-6 DNA methylase [Spirochaetia bacterium]
MIGTISEELLRRFNESHRNENPDEHSTPRDVVHLMVNLMPPIDETEIRARKAIRTVYDPCRRSGEMLMIS